MVLVRRGRERWMFLVTLFALLSGSGCTSWRPAQVSDAPYPNRVRVSLVEAKVVYVDDARILGDTALAGRLPSLQPYSVPLGKIQEVQEKYTSAGRTLLAIGATAAVVYLAGAILLTNAIRDVTR